MSEYVPIDEMKPQQTAWYKTSDDRYCVLRVNEEGYVSISRSNDCSEVTLDPEFLGILRSIL